MRSLRRAILLAAAALAVGCRQRPEPSAAPEPAGERTTLTFRHSPIGGHEMLFHQILEGFERANPGVSVVDETMPGHSEQTRQLYALNLSGGNAAFDVMALDIVWIAEFARAGWLEDLSAWFPAEEQTRFLPGAIQAATVQGRPYAVPWFTDAGLLYYRKDLLEKYRLAPPETWEDLVRAAREVVDREADPNLAGFVWQGKQYEGLVCNAMEYLASNGARVLDDRGRWALDEGRAREALGLMADLVQRHRISPELVLAADEETTRHVFGEGHAVFLRNWPYARAFFDSPDSPVAGKVGIAPLPHFPGSASAGTLGGWFLGVNRYSRNPALAYKLAAYITSEDVQRQIYARVGFLPTRVSLYRDPELRARAPELRVFERILAQARPRPATPRYPSVSGVLQDELSAVLAGTKTPERAVRDLRRRVESIVSADAE